MEESAGFHGFPGNLDPRAQEFIPRNIYHHHLPPFVPSNSNFFYPNYPYPPPPPPSQPPFLPFSSPPQAAYVSTDHHYSLVTTSVISSSSSSSRKTMPSRALLLTTVPANVSESTVRRELEVFGDVRAVQMEKVREGIVTVHFYNIRQAQMALNEIQAQHMQHQYRLRRHYEMNYYSFNNNGPSSLPPPPLPPPAPGLIMGRAVWAQFVTPVASSIPNGNNQGTLVLFNLDPDATTTSLKQTFEAFGPVKELRETPMKRYQRFVEFYDVRDAAKAYEQMNGKEIHGKQIVIEYSRPGGGFSKKHHSKFPGINFTNTGPNFANNYPVARPILPPSPPSPALGYHYSAAPFSDKRSKGCTRRANGEIRRGAIHNSMANLSVNNGNYSDKSGNLRSSSSKKDSKKNVITSSSRNNSSSKQQQKTKESSSFSKAWKGLNRQSSKEYDPRFLINEDAILESSSICKDSRTTVMIKNIPNKYSQKLLLNMLDNHCIHCNEQITGIGGGDDNQPPLSSYDFVYLPIDFVNKCNVGYGFVNMTSPEATLRLYKAFHRQSWEVFNSRKICEVTYARLQGVEALKEHFKNSKFPCQADEYMPVVFSPPRDGRELTDPAPIITRSAGVSTTTCSSSSPAVSSKEEWSENGDFQEGFNINGGGGGHDYDGADGGGGRSSSNGGDSGDQYYHDDGSHEYN